MTRCPGDQVDEIELSRDGDAWGCRKFAGQLQPDLDGGVVPSLFRAVEGGLNLRPGEMEQGSGR